MTSSSKVKLLLKNLLNNLLGISTEMLAGIAFISIGFLVCALWWSLVR